MLVETVVNFTGQHFQFTLLETESGKMLIKIQATLPQHEWKQIIHIGSDNQNQENKPQKE